MQITQSIRDAAARLVGFDREPSNLPLDKPASVEYLKAVSRLEPDTVGDPAYSWADTSGDTAEASLYSAGIHLRVKQGQGSATHIVPPDEARRIAYAFLALADLYDDAHPPAPLDRFARLKRDILAVAERGDDPSNVRLGRIVKIVRDGDETWV